jgi:hypothetical protein
MLCVNRPPRTDLAPFTAMALRPIGDYVCLTNEGLSDFYVQGEYVL